MEKENTSTYYFAEIERNVMPFLSDACGIAAAFKVGNLSVLEKHLRQAYIERHGRSIPDDKFEQVVNLISMLQRLVWDTTYKNDNIVHKLSPDADVFFDIKEVVDYQLALDEGTEKSINYPMHWNDDIQQIRFFAKRESKYNRAKQLPLFVQEQKVGSRSR